LYIFNEKAVNVQEKVAIGAQFYYC